MKRLIFNLALVFTLVFGVMHFAGLANYSSAEAEAYGLDTIAGYTTYLTSSPVTPNSDVVFTVLKPDGTSINISSYAGSNGIAKAELPKEHTQVTGKYNVALRLADGSTSDHFNSFTVYSDGLSNSYSVIEPKDQVINTGDEVANLKVKLVDSSGNPVSGHVVKLVSSSTDDNVVLLNGSNLSNENGEVAYQVSSMKPGIVTYSAYDVTADIILDARAKVVYFDSTDYVFTNSKTNFTTSFAAAGNSTGVVDNFKFEDVPQTVSPGQSVTFTVTAADEGGQKVTDYSGKVRFSVTSPNSNFAVLPEDYQFTAQDMGSHTFSLAMLFQETGNYDVEVRDLQNGNILGKQTFVVSNDLSTGSNQNGAPVISNPVSGISSNNIQVVSGTAKPGSQVKIFDNEVEIGSVVTDSQGKFSFTSPVLVDGVHNIYVAEVNGVGTIVSQSDTVELNVDTSSPSASQVVIEPSDEGVTPGSAVTVKLYIQEKLAQASVIFQNNIYEMTDNGQGQYVTTFTAPVDFGDYPITFVLVDELGNESRLENEATLNVGGLLAEPESEKPADVKNVEAQFDDKRVTLTWDPVQPTKNQIQNYRVFYGLSPNQLTEAVDTFTNSPTWYIPNLTNGVTYYFAVVAVDDKGNISERFSNMVQAIPTPLFQNVADPDVQMGIAGEEALMEMEKDASESGPEILWLVLLSLVGGTFYSASAKKRFRHKADNACVLDVHEEIDAVKKSFRDCLFK